MHANPVVHHNGIARVYRQQMVGVAVEDAVCVGVLPMKRHDSTIRQDGVIRVKFVGSPEPSWMRPIRQMRSKRKLDRNGTNGF